MTQIAMISQETNRESTRVRLTVPTSLYSPDAVRFACHSLRDQIDIQVLAEDHAATLVELVPSNFQVTVETALSMFRRELLVAAVNRQARLDDLELQQLFANSAYSVTTQRVTWMGQASDELAGRPSDESPNIERPEGQPEPRQAADTEAGYTYDIDRDRHVVRFRMDSRRYLLPVILSAGKELGFQLRLRAEPRNGFVTNVVIHPRDGHDLDEAINGFLGYVSRWALPGIPHVPTGTVSAEETVNADLLAVAMDPANPARPGNGLPLTYFRTLYGNWEGVSVPYRLNELFTMEVAPNLYLVSTRHRAWAILTHDQYRALVELRAHEDESAYGIYEDLGLILTPRNVQKVAAMHAQRYSYMHRPPSLFILVVTNRCNMACDYCHAEAGEAGNYSLDMTEETVYKAIDFFFSIPSLQKRDVFHLEFQGGECVLRWDMIKVAMDYANELAAKRGMKTQFTLCTNLTTMTDEIAREIVRRGNIGISSSLDGPRDVNDRQRVFASGAGTYDKATYWSNRLREVYGLRHGTLPTLTQNNLGHEVELVDEYRSRQANAIYLRYVNQTGRAFTDSYDVLGLSPDDYVGLWRTAVDHILENDLKGEHLVERKSANLLGNMLTLDWSYMCLRRPCGIGANQVVIDQKGDIYGCDQARSNPLFCMGNVHTDSYDTVYTCDTARTLRSLTSELYPRCRSCALNAFCGYCVSRGARQHGTPQPKMPEDFECMIYTHMVPELFRDLMEPHRAMMLNLWAR